jgi:hypothetical protein
MKSCAPAIETKQKQTMNSETLHLTALALLPAALFAFTSCSSAPKGPNVTQTTTVIQTRDGAMIVDSVTLIASVTAIDAATRQLTLTSSNGFQKTITAGKSVINFDQIKVGDQVNVRATEEFAVFLRPAGTQRSAGEGAVVALAPRGSMPGGLAVSTQEVTAKITAVDVVNPGDKVTVQVAESLAIAVTRP